VDHLYVNTTKFDVLNVGFDISFPEIPCGLLTIDAADETGISQKNAQFRVKKHKIDKGLNKVGHPLRQLPGNAIKTEDELLKKARAKNETSVCGNSKSLQQRVFFALCPTCLYRKLLRSWRARRML
jgi:hypothetical protein